MDDMLKLLTYFKTSTNESLCYLAKTHRESVIIPFCLKNRLTFISNFYPRSHGSSYFFTRRISNEDRVYMHSIVDGTRDERTGQLIKEIGLEQILDVLDVEILPGLRFGYFIETWVELPELPES